MKLNLKYNATKIDEIEKEKKQPIENCISDTSVSTMALFIQKGLVDENGRIGVSRAVALDTIDKYLEESDKDNLIFDIMEALVEAGFLTKGLDIANLRKLKEEREAQFKKEIEKEI